MEFGAEITPELKRLFCEDPHVDHPVFQLALSNNLPEVYHDVVVTGIKKGYPFYNHYIDDGIELLRFVEEKSLWFSFSKMKDVHAWVRKDGLVIYALSKLSLGQIAKCFLGRQLETVYRNYAYICPSTASVDESVQSVVRPSSPMKVAAFEVLRNRTEWKT